MKRKKQAPESCRSLTVISILLESFPGLLRPPALISLECTCQYFHQPRRRLRSSSRVSIKPLSRIEVAAKEATRQILSASKVTRFPGEQWKAIHYLIFKLASAHLTACLHGSPGHDKAVQSPPPTRIALRSAGRVLQIIDESKDEEEDNRSSKEGLVAATKQFRAWLSTLSARGLDYKRLLSPHRVLGVGELLAELGEFGQSVRLMDQSFPPPPTTTTTTKKTTATKQPSTAASRITTAVTSILNRIVGAPSSSSTDIEGNQGGEKKNPEEGAVPPGIVVDLLEAKGRILIKELYSSTYVTDRAADRRSLSNAVQSAREAKLSQKRRLSAFEAKGLPVPLEDCLRFLACRETLGRALALAGQYGFMISGFISRRSALEAFNEADRELKYCINTWRRRVDGEELQGQGEMSVPKPSSYAAKPSSSSSSSSSSSATSPREHKLSKDDDAKLPGQSKQGEQQGQRSALSATSSSDIKGLAVSLAALAELRYCQGSVRSPLVFGGTLSREEIAMQSIDLFNEALTLMEKVGAEETPECIEIMKDLGKVYSWNARRGGDPRHLAKGQTILRRAHRIQLNLRGSGHPNTSNIRRLAGERIAIDDDDDEDDDDGSGDDSSTA